VFMRLRVCANTQSRSILLISAA